MCIDLALALVDRNLVFRRTGYLLLQLLYNLSALPVANAFYRLAMGFRAWYSYQVVENALVQRPLELPALPELLVVVVEAFPVLAELCQAVLVHVVQSVILVRNDSFSCTNSGSILPMSLQSSGLYVHAGCASCDLATLPQAVQLSPSVRLRLALHVVIVVGLAAGSNEEACAHERGGRRSNLLDFGNGVRERSGVHEDLLVESGRKWLVNVPHISNSGMLPTWVVWRPFCGINGWYTTSYSRRLRAA